jgi:hypothetical protein
MDEADRAQEESERLDELIRKRRYRTLAAVGRCHFCAEDVEGTRLFCDNGVPGDRGCADDYEIVHKGDRLE